MYSRPGRTQSLPSMPASVVLVASCTTTETVKRLQVRLIAGQGASKPATTPAAFEGLLIVCSLWYVLLGSRNPVFALPRLTRPSDLPAGRQESQSRPVTVTGTNERRRGDLAACGIGCGAVDGRSSPSAATGAWPHLPRAA
jgi:hypothetical protein